MDNLGRGNSMMREIGSEFWLDMKTYSRLKERSLELDEADIVKMKGDCRKKLSLPESEDFHMLFSGRTAIDMVVVDIKARLPFDKVYIPSYCPYSMVLPFVDRGIAVEFYPVNYAEGMKLEIGNLVGQNVLITTNYFGYGYGYDKETLEAFRNRGGIIIHDTTHGIMRDDCLDFPYDYLIASLHKWTSVISGALAMKKNGEFKPYPLGKVESGRIESMYESLALKNDYIQGKDIDKGAFNPKIKAFHQILDLHYRNLDVDTISLLMMNEQDKAFCRDQRQVNAKYIHERISGIPDLKPMFPLKQEDVPLNVPVIVDRETRNGLQQFMADHAVFLPTHWGASDIVFCPSGDSNIYDKELSLVCDQRYNLDDIAREMDLIEEFMGIQTQR